MARACFLVFLSSALCGCATGFAVQHSEPRVVADTVRLAAQASGDADGALLRVYREREVVREQEIWRERRWSAGPFPSTPRSVASVGVDWSSADESGVYMVAAIVAVCIVLFPFAAVFWAGYGVVALVDYATFDDHRVAHRTSQVSREMCLAATIETPDGTFRLDLGPQPEQGYWLGKDAVARLGGAGVEVVIRDGDLTTTLRLPGLK